MKIFEKDKYIGPANYSGLVEQSLFVIAQIKLFYKNNSTLAKLFLAENTEIHITSQDRGIEPHTNGKAVDITCYPFYMNIYLATILASMPTCTVYISTYNFHIHSDNRKSGSVFPKCEVLYRNGKRYDGLYSTSKKTEDVIKIENFSDNLFRLMTLNQLPGIRSYKQSIPLSNLVLSKKEKITLVTLSYFDRSISDYNDYYFNYYKDTYEIVKETGKEIIKDVKSSPNKIISIIGAAALILIITKNFLKGGGKNGTSKTE